MFQELIKIFKQTLPNNKIDYNSIDGNSNIFDDVCFNSSALVMVAHAIENKFHIILPGYLEVRNATVGDVIKMIESELRK